jgi:hypothetical protein
MANEHRWPTNRSRNRPWKGPWQLWLPPGFLGNIILNDTIVKNNTGTIDPEATAKLWAYPAILKYRISDFRTSKICLNFI